ASAQNLASCLALASLWSSQCSLQCSWAIKLFADNATNFARLFVRFRSDGGPAAVRICDGDLQPVASAQML
ncbi:hypothetical protein, partial [Stenotrophomonas sp. GbtcB23]|uniref:hypothetical protein n=1 Tax=Stenotrophomonas sp. GbtcB23 TaxID=2824768 RepID=UPI001C2FB54C